MLLMMVLIKVGTEVPGRSLVNAIPAAIAVPCGLFSTRFAYVIISLALLGLLFYCLAILAFPRTGG